MKTTTHTPTTARGLFAILAPFGPRVEAGELMFDLDPPEALDRVLLRLHTGARAVLSRRPWFGCDGKTGRVVELNPGAPIPDGITLVCVEGDPRWDRLPPTSTPTV